jgi:CRP/FNR family cyclic AMP-dependent transcriptional regulator
MDWPLLTSLDADERAAVARTERVRRYRHGEIVFHEGDPADRMHLVVTGHVAVRVSTRDGSTAMLSVLGPGDLFGEVSLSADRSRRVLRSASVVALDDTETRTLPLTLVHDLCDRHPDVLRGLADVLADRVRRLSARVVDLMYVGLDRRLYSSLLDLAERFDADAARPVVPLTQEQLADYVGGTRPSVNQVLQRLAAEGIVELGRGRVELADSTALARKAGRPPATAAPGT